MEATEGSGNDLNDICDSVESDQESAEYAGDGGETAGGNTGLAEKASCVLRGLGRIFLLVIGLNTSR
jgi:hypothetical protein